MARAPSGARRRAASGRRAAGSGGEAVRKGTWTPDEDAVLLEHVREHGPSNWSSIRSKGLLPRTGKSCRLRWVNKLRPNLKDCKFFAEEERVVLDLQEKFGNKWARIATYLPGRTDNDVKNFWSTRQKRLARLRRSPLPGPSGINLSAKMAAASSSASELDRCFFPDQVPFKHSSSSRQCAATQSMDAQNAAPLMYDQTGFQHLGSGGAFLPALPAPDIRAWSSNAAPLLPSTDMVVDNSWNTSQNQYGRLLRTPFPGESSRSCRATTGSDSSLQPPPSMGSFLDPVPFGGRPSDSQCRAGTVLMDAQKSELAPYDQIGSQLFGFGGAQPPVALATDNQASSSNADSLWPPQLQLYEPYPLLDFPGIGGSGDVAPGFVNAGAVYDFTCHQELPPFMQSSMAFPFLGMHGGVKIEPPVPPRDHFDDLPPDIFDSADQLPPTSSPSRTISDF